MKIYLKNKKGVANAFNTHYRELREKLANQITVTN